MGRLFYKTKRKGKKGGRERKENHGTTLEIKVSGKLQQEGRATSKGS